MCQAVGFRPGCPTHTQSPLQHPVMDRLPEGGAAAHIWFWTLCQKLISQTGQKQYGRDQAFIVRTVGRPSSKPPTRNSTYLPTCMAYAKVPTHQYRLT